MNLDVVAPFPAERMNLSNEEGLSRRLEAAALSRNREAFAQHLAQALHISRTQARRVADDDLGSGNASKTVTVNNVAPTVALDGVNAINENGVATLTGSVSNACTAGCGCSIPDRRLIGGGSLSRRI